jgi:hypothetical protein
MSSPEEDEEEEDEQQRQPPAASPIGETLTAVVKLHVDCFGADLKNIALVTIKVHVTPIWVGTPVGSGRDPKFTLEGGAPFCFKKTYCIS